jgi:hypothetical protein
MEFLDVIKIMNARVRLVIRPLYGALFASRLVFLVTRTSMLRVISANPINGQLRQKQNKKMATFL